MYIGETDRELVVRAREHQQQYRSQGKPIYEHLFTCEEFKTRRTQYVIRKRKEKDKRCEDKIKFDFFLEHFSIVQKNFVSTYQRKKQKPF